MKPPHGLIGLVIAAGVLFGIADPSHAEGEAPTTPTSLADILESICTKHRVPALAAATYREGSVTDIAVAGVRSVGSKEQVSVEDRWHIGSCTKSMTATLAALLVEDGRIKWETTVGDILKDAPGLDEGWHAATLEQLLQHRAGAPATPPAALWAAAWEHAGKPIEQRRDFVFGLLRTPPKTKPGSSFKYSNQGYSIAGTMLEQVTGQPWEDLMRERLFRPLGMQSAGFGAPAPNQPLGHEGKRPPLKPIGMGPDADNPAAIGPGGTVHCSIADFARYAGFHADLGRSNKSLLKPDSFARLHQPAAGGDYALGWNITKRSWAGGRTLNHDGSNTLWYAIMWVAPEKRAAFVAVTNCASNTAFSACDEAVTHLINRAFKGN